MHHDDSGELNRLLVRRFPGLLDGYLEIKRLWGGEEPGAHIVYGDLLVPMIGSALGAPNEHQGLSVVMGFLEELSSSGNPYALEVIVVSVLEPFAGDRLRQRLEAEMGPRIQKLWRRVLADRG